MAIQSVSEWKQSQSTVKSIDTSSSVSKIQSVSDWQKTKPAPKVEPTGVDLSNVNKPKFDLTQPNLMVDKTKSIITPTEKTTQAIPDKTTPNITPLTIAKIPIDLIKGIYESEVRPSQEELDLEKQAFGSYPKLIQNTLAVPSKVIYRFFQPMLQPFAEDISQDVQANFPEKFGMKPEDVLNLPVFKKSSTQIVGDTAQAVLTAYMPSIFGKTAVEAVDKSLSSAFLNGAKNGAQGGLMFGVSQAASSGSTDPSEWASIIAKTTFGLSLLGGITSSVVPLAKNTLDTFKKETVKQTGLTPEQVDSVISIPTETKTEVTPMVMKDVTPEILGESKPITVTKPSISTDTKTPASEVANPKLSEDIQTLAIEKKLTEDLGPLPEYNTMNMKEQAKMASDLIKNDYEKARRIAMGEEQPPTGLRPATMWKAMEQVAIKNGDINLIRDLAISSKVPTLLSTYGQEIKAADIGFSESPVKAIQDLQKVKEDVLTKKGVKDIKKAKKEEAQKIKDEIKKKSPTKQNWQEFIKSIQC